MAGQVLQSRMHQAAGAAEITAPVCELGFEELKFRAAKRGVVCQPVKAILGLGADQPVEQQAVPFRQIRSSLVTVAARG